MNKNDKRRLKQRRAVCWNEYRRKMAYKKHPHIKRTVLLVYQLVRTALPSRCVFFDVLSTHY